jgi:hypothetical protein
MQLAVTVVEVRPAPREMAAADTVETDEVAFNVASVPAKPVKSYVASVAA